MAETKIKDSLKKILIGELTEKQEKDRLERIKANSKLKKITLYTDKDSPICKPYEKALEKEGIKYTKIEIKEKRDKWNKIISTTGMGAIPVIEVNNNYLIYRRDFNNSKSLIQAIQHFANPNFKSPKIEDQLIEKSKTNFHNLFMKMNQLEQKLTPIVNFVNNLQKQLAEEEKNEQKNN
tara:strand:- start:58 stop:594 length:537 start_codon:yes stop_codon:yes gene_type:complete